jgi:organic hydroperoxide reductase OsmC/OhrA
MGRELEILYTGVATAVGGRQGHARTNDGRLEVDLDVPVLIGLLENGGQGLAAAIDLDVPRIPREEAVELMRRAHETCPYSRATRGNIGVTLTFDGARLDLAA